MCADDAETREEACHELFGTLWHQGTVYPATAPAVPFLVRIAATSPHPERADVLLLLAAIATGAGYLAVHGTLMADLIGDLTGDADLAAEETAERAWVSAAHEAGAGALPTLIGLLADADADADVRQCAAFAVAQVASRADEARQALLTTLGTDEDPGVAATCLIALMTLATPPEQIDPVFAQAPTRQRPDVQAIAAVARCGVTPSPAHIADLTARLTRDGDAALELLASTPWAFEGDPLDLVTAPLAGDAAAVVAVFSALATTPARPP